MNKKARELPNDDLFEVLVMRAEVMQSRKRAGASSQEEIEAAAQQGRHGMADTFGVS